MIPSHPFATPWFTGWSLAAVLAVLAVGRSAHGETVIGNYDLAGGSYANTLSGSGALGPVFPVSTSGSFGFVTSGTNPAWSWSDAGAPGTGLVLSGLPANDGTTFGSYSIGMRFSVGQISGYRKLIDFDQSPYGLYVLDGQLRFYNDGSNPTGGTLVKNGQVDFILTRHVSGTVTGYLDGSQAFSAPLGNDARTDSLRTLRFFLDNPGIGDFEFSPSGSIGLLRIWNGPLTAAEIPNAMTALVPEPSGFVLAATAVIGALWRAGCRRFKRV